jgi:hypothetical protein
MFKVIESKGIQHSGTFWTWENKVSRIRSHRSRELTAASNTRGEPLRLPNEPPLREKQADDIRVSVLDGLLD